MVTIPIDRMWRNGGEWRFINKIGKVEGGLQDYVEGMRPQGLVIAMYVEETTNLTGSFLFVFTQQIAATRGGQFSDITIICKPSQRDPLKVQRVLRSPCEAALVMYSVFSSWPSTNYIIYTSELLTRLHFLILLLYPLFLHFLLCTVHCFVDETHNILKYCGYNAR